MLRCFFGGPTLYFFRPPLARRSPQLRRASACVIALALTAATQSCSAPPKVAATQPTDRLPLPVPPAQNLPVLWSASSARRQSNFIKVNLPIVVSGTQIDIGQPAGLAAWINDAGGVTLFSSRIVRGSVSGPDVDQLTGAPSAASDAGSYLLPLSAPVSKPQPAGRMGHFTVREPMPLFFKIAVSALQEPGEYKFPVTVTLPGKPSEVAILSVSVSDIALPTDSRVLAIATTTAADLARIFPSSFGKINGQYLDRGDPDHTAAVAQLDELMKVAQRNGVALFVEDLGPTVKVDEVGRVTLNWDAYDRVMQPYMDGAAFPDRVPLAAWLAPAPPRRISDSPTQLRQYVAACTEHFSDKAWVATPAFMHPALVTPEETVDPALRDEISKMLRLHMTRDMLAVTTPDAKVPQPRLWVVDDSDPRLPPAGPLATEETVRLWPWVCAARSVADANGAQVKGFVWRNALAGAAQLTGDPAGPALRPLFVALNGSSRPKENASSNAPSAVSEIAPSLRMLWLGEGLNDIAMVGLLEQRADPSVVQELFAGMVGRTGLTTDSVPTAPDAVRFSTISPGYLYAGWPQEKSHWTTMPGMLEKLVLANDPGAGGKPAENDPLFMATKLWLANARRPVARVAGYQFNVHSGREGDLLDWKIQLLAENPINTPVQMETRIPLLPGDLELAGQSTGNRAVQSLDVPGYGLAAISLPLTGQLDSIEPSPAPKSLELSERHGGAFLQLPLTVPIFHMRPTEVPLKIDGQAGDWPADPQTARLGVMTVGLHYLSRPDFLRGTLRPDESPAVARWTYDHDFLYVVIHCPQTSVADQRNNDWPTQSHRWWGTDGVQIQLASASGELKRVVQLGFKPGGAMLTRVAQVRPGESPRWSDGPPAGGSVRYGISLEKTDGRVGGYIVEAAIPRSWFPEPRSQEETPPSPAWRVNILRHRESDLQSMSWSGPVANDEDVAMMGLLVGKP